MASKDWSESEGPTVVPIGTPRVLPVEDDRVERLGPGRLEVKRRLASNPFDPAMGAPGSNSASPSVHPDRKDSPLDRRAAAVDGQDIHDAFVFSLQPHQRRGRTRTTTDRGPTV